MRTLVYKQPGANLPFGKDKFESFTNIQTGNILLGRKRNYTSIRSEKVCVVREGLPILLLDNSSTNGKRVRADGEAIEDIVLPGGKKPRMTPM